MVATLKVPVVKRHLAIGIRIGRQRDHIVRGSLNDASRVLDTQLGLSAEGCTRGSCARGFCTEDKLKNAMSKALLVADVRPVAVAEKYNPPPALLMLKPENVATPLEAAATVCVPDKDSSGRVCSNGDRDIA